LKVDLNNWYNKSDLEEWLKNKGAKVSGKKQVLMDRIIKYLSGDIPGATERKVPKKRKRTTSRSKSPSKKKLTPKKREKTNTNPRKKRKMKK